MMSWIKPLVFILLFLAIEKRENDGNYNSDFKTLLNFNLVIYCGSVILVLCKQNEFFKLRLFLYLFIPCELLTQTFYLVRKWNISQTTFLSRASASLDEASYPLTY